MKKPTEFIKVTKIFGSVVSLSMILSSFGHALLYGDIFSVVLTILFSFLFTATFYSKFLDSWIGSE